MAGLVTVLGGTGGPAVSIGRPELVAYRLPERACQTLFPLQRG
jgi:hypothetical protein